eukprot:CAMPEP_0119035752 /NCGR_PEP_ID=MMETSP1177-20130426/2953_1 /TAXON_ID=2985 /ORGANISM="Ochromonas sp, Strain CCMP1899" /LENGTH=792 /DNA_ID=CAMNT_0006994463 /DNA_START=13 /DNA_END=2388 /DNA_ORIENTATION=+
MFGNNSTMRFELRDSLTQNKHLTQQIHQQRDQITEFSNRLQENENVSAQFELELTNERDSMKLIRQKLVVEKENNLILAQNFNNKMNILIDVQYQLQKEEIKTKELMAQITLEKEKSATSFKEKQCNTNIIHNQAVTFEKINHVINLLSNDKNLKHNSEIEKETDPNVKLQLLLDELSMTIERKNRRNSMDNHDTTQLALSFQEEEDSLQSTIKKLRDEKLLINRISPLTRSLLPSDTSRSLPRRKAISQDEDDNDIHINTAGLSIGTPVPSDTSRSPPRQHSSINDEVSPYDRFEEPKILQWLSHDGVGETTELSFAGSVLDEGICEEIEALLIQSNQNIAVISEETIGEERDSLSPLSLLLLKQRLLDELSVKMLANHQNNILNNMDHKDVTDIAILFQEEENSLESIIQTLRDEKSLSYMDHKDINDIAILYQEKEDIFVQTLRDEKSLSSSNILFQEEGDSLESIIQALRDEKSLNSSNEIFSESETLRDERSLSSSNEIFSDVKSLSTDSDDFAIELEGSLGGVLGESLEGILGESLGESDSDDFAIESTLFPCSESPQQLRKTNESGGLSNSNGSLFSEEVSPYDRFEEPKILQWLTQDSPKGSAESESEMLLPLLPSLASDKPILDEVISPINLIHDKKVSLSGDVDIERAEVDFLSPESTSHTLTPSPFRCEDSDQINAHIEIVVPASIEEKAMIDLLSPESTSHTITPYRCQDSDQNARIETVAPALSEEKAMIDLLKQQIIQINTNQMSESSELHSVQSKFSPFSDSDMRIKARSGKFDSHW